MAGKSLLLATLFLVLLAAQGSEAKMVALVYGQVPCSSGTMINMPTSAVFPNASVQLVLSGGVPISGTGTTTTNKKGQFLINVPVTSRDMLVSLASNSSKVVVTTPLAACNSALPAVGTMAAPVRLRASRRLTTSPADKFLRDLICSDVLLPGEEVGNLCSELTQEVLGMLIGDESIFDGRLGDGSVLGGLVADEGLLGGLLGGDLIGGVLGGDPSGGLLGGDPLVGFARFSAGSFSYSA